jgi:hypothetical protein
MMRLRELSGILGRMRELVLLLKANPEPEQFVVLLELSLKVQVFRFNSHRRLPLKSEHERNPVVS